MKKEITNKEYHADKKHISASGLKVFAQSPLNYQMYINSEFKQTDAMFFGSAVHDLIECTLKNKIDKFYDEYIFFDLLEIKKFGESPNRRTKEYQSWKKELFTSNKTLVDSSVSIIVDNLLSINIIKKLLSNGECEPSYFHEVNKNSLRQFKLSKIKGMKVKTRYDFVNYNDSYIVDYKTIRDTPTEYICNYTINKMKYYLQVGIYALIYELETGKKLKNFYFFWLQNQEPYDINVTQVDTYEIDNCIDLIIPILEKFKNYKPVTIFEANNYELAQYSVPAYLYK